MHIDEAPLQVLRSGKAVGAEHYIVMRWRPAGPPDHPVRLHRFAHQGALKQLIGADGAYRGKLISDGLERYDEIAAELNLLHFGCLQHCRSMFFKARKVSQLPSSRTLANVAIETYIRQVYQVESEIRALQEEHHQRGESLPWETVLTLREQKSKPVLDQFKAWVDELLLGTPPNSALGKALAYTTRPWPKLIRHLQHAEIPVDNNYIQRQIKHYATGRKSWLFSYDAVGAQASANLFSLVMTARANDVEPYAYLNYLFEYLPAASTVEQKRCCRGTSRRRCWASTSKNRISFRNPPPPEAAALYRYGVNRALLSDQMTSMPSTSGSLPPTWMLKCLRSAPLDKASNTKRRSRLIGSVVTSGTHQHACRITGRGWLRPGPITAE